MAKKQKTSLERSHSAWSNTKLTTLCIISSIAVTCLWVVLGLKDFFFNNNLEVVFYIGLAGSVVVTALTLLMFNKFKR